MTMQLIEHGAESVTATDIFILLTIELIGSCIRPQQKLGLFFGTVTAQYFFSSSAANVRLSPSLIVSLCAQSKQLFL